MIKSKTPDSVSTPSSVEGGGEAVADDATSRRFEVVYPITGENGKTRWAKVGTAFLDRAGTGFDIMLDSIPINFNGKLYARPFKPFVERKSK